MIFITGGARSGKSSLAERLALERGGEVTYIATAEAGDAEMRERIRRHRSSRPAAWRTVETIGGLPGAVEGALETGGTVLVDCLTVYLSNLLVGPMANEERREEPRRVSADETGRMESLRKNIGEQVNRLVEVCRSGNGRVILVSNEVGMGIVPDNALGRVFRDVSGWANQKLAEAADEVYLCVSGIPLKVK